MIRTPFSPGEHVVASVLYKVWLPPVQRAITNKWNPRDSSALLKLLDSWEPVLPTFLLDQILTSNILPKLASEVENWDPTKDTQLIHAWIHPWLLHLGEHFTDSINPVIRQKFTKVLKRWNALDPTAREILLPWHDVWDNVQWKKLMRRAILPGMVAFFDTAKTNQLLVGIAACLTWLPELIAPSMFADEVLGPHVFPKFLQELKVRLRTDAESAAVWYEQMKDALQPSLQQTHAAQIGLQRGLNLISAALEGNAEPEGPVTVSDDDVEVVSQTPKGRKVPAERDAAFTTPRTPANFGRTPRTTCRGTRAAVTARWSSGVRGSQDVEVAGLREASRALRCRS